MQSLSLIDVWIITCLRSFSINSFLSMTAASVQEGHTGFQHGRGGTGIGDGIGVGQARRRGGFHAASTREACHIKSVCVCVCVSTCVDATGSLAPSNAFNATACHITSLACCPSCVCVFLPAQA